MGRRRDDPRTTRLFRLALLAAIPSVAPLTAHADGPAPPPTQTQPATPASDTSKSPPPPKRRNNAPALRTTAPADTGATWVGPSYAIRGVVLELYARPLAEALSLKPRGSPAPARRRRKGPRSSGNGRCPACPRFTAREWRLPSPARKGPQRSGHPGRDHQVGGGDAAERPSVSVRRARVRLRLKAATS